jgi:hypothetical protein
MSWQLSEEDRRRIAAEVARQKKAQPGPLPERTIRILAELLAERRRDDRG